MPYYNENDDDDDDERRESHRRRDDRTDGNDELEQTAESFERISKHR